MTFLDRLLYPMQHCEDATAHLLASLNVKYTRSHLQKKMKEHPNYPSLLSIADVIGSSYNVSCIPLSFTREEILAEPEIQAPFIAHVSSTQSGDGFAVVKNFSRESIELYFPGSMKNETVSPKAFDEAYLGTILMARGEDNFGEIEYEKNLAEERRRSVFHNAIAFTIPALTLTSCMIAVIISPEAGIVTPIIYTLLTLLGCSVGALLLWHEVDEYNPVVKQICQTGQKVNCSAILNSKASKIFGLSWSSIGFSYFMGTLLVLIMGGIVNSAFLQLVSWINVLALPYIVFSVYYQWKVAKQWCVLCLMVQALLLFQFITALIGSFHSLMPLQSISQQTYLTIACAYILPFITILLLIPAFEKAKERQGLKYELTRLKHNPQIFEALLSRQMAIERPAENLGISIGNPNGVYKLIKVCNPYCGPCSTAHPAMDALVHNNEEISLQIIFSATENETDYRKLPVTHLMAIDSKNDKTLTQKALDDWYSMPVKEYTEFADRYPLNGDLKKQDEKIKMMREWCDKTGITFTPTFFICMNMANKDTKFYKLPEMYSVDDLKYFLTI